MANCGYCHELQGIKDVSIVYTDSIDQNALIEIITKEVMKRVEEKINRSELVSSPRKNKILAVAMPEDAILNEKSDLYSVDYYETYDEHISIMPYDFIVLGHLSYQELTQISMGLSYDQVSSIVIECILANKKIFIINEGVDYHTYEDTANTNFYAMLKGYEERLRTFGIEWIYANEINRRIQDLTSEKPEIVNKSFVLKEDHVQEKIITESLAKQYHMNGCKQLMIKKNTIVTPSAWDYLRDNKINVVTTQI